MAKENTKLFACEKVFSIGYLGRYHKNSWARNNFLCIYNCSEALQPALQLHYTALNSTGGNYACLIAFRNGSRIESDIITDSSHSNHQISDSLLVSSRQSDGAGADTGPEEDIGGGSVIRARVKCTVAVLAGGNYRRQHQQDVCCQPDRPRMWEYRGYEGEICEYLMQVKYQSARFC